MEILRDLVLISTVASITGVFLGYMVVNWVEDAGLLVMFGETIHAVINTELLVILCAISICIHVCSGLMVSSVLTKARPRHLMQDSDILEREDQAPTLETVLGVDS